MVRAASAGPSVDPLLPADLNTLSVAQGELEHAQQLVVGTGLLKHLQRGRVQVVVLIVLRRLFQLVDQELQLLVP